MGSTPPLERPWPASGQQRRLIHVFSTLDAAVAYVLQLEPWQLDGMTFKVEPQVEGKATLSAADAGRIALREDFPSR